MLGVGTMLSHSYPIRDANVCIEALKLLAKQGAESPGKNRYFLCIDGLGELRYSSLNSSNAPGNHSNAKQWKWIFYAFYRYRFGCIAAQMHSTADRYAIVYIDPLWGIRCHRISLCTENIVDAAACRPRLLAIWDVLARDTMSVVGGCTRYDIN